MIRWHGWTSWRAIFVTCSIALGSTILVAISVPMFQKNIAEADTAKARQDLDTLRQAISLRESGGRKFTGMDELAGGRYVQEIPVDPEGNPYQYDPVRRVLRGVSDGETVEVALGSPPPLYGSGSDAGRMSALALPAPTSPRVVENRAPGTVADIASDTSPPDGEEPVIQPPDPRPARAPEAAPFLAASSPASNPLPEGFQDPREEPLSTFAIDVDTASWGRTRAAWRAGRRPWPQEVRTEELVNAFPYQIQPPAPGDVIGVTSETSYCPWAPERFLMRIGLRGHDGGPRVPANLVFLCDVSGSMESPERLPLLKDSLKLLLDRLYPEDRVSLVTYAGTTGIVLPPTRASSRDLIRERIESLGAGGGTCGSSGIDLAYRAAQEGFRKDGINRVILATDGDFNMGISDPVQLEELIAEKAKTGVYLTVLGFGDSLEGDHRMETLADRGNGAYHHIGELSDAGRALFSQVDGTLITVARDVKIQISFDPRTVAGYRQLGYENRALASQDFADDAKDGGELGAGQQVTALYEIIPVARSAVRSVTTLPPTLGRIAIRYQDPRLVPGEPAASSKLITREIPLQVGDLSQASHDHRFAAATAWLGLILRRSPEITPPAGDDLASAEELLPHAAPFERPALESIERLSADIPDDPEVHEQRHDLHDYVTWLLLPPGVR